MIKLTNVSKEYPKRGHALRDVTLHMKKGEFAFLTGHSGSGKSTTLRLIHMADRPTNGEVRVTGYSTDRITDRDLWKVRRRVGFVFQDFRLLPGRTALENVSFVLEVTGTASKDVVQRAQRLLAQVGLSTKAGALVHELSGGEQQRVAIARALANDPYVLLADEPTGNLDDRATRGVMDLLWDINAKGMAVLMATHDLDLVRRYPHARLFELDQGEVVYDSFAAEGDHVRST
ncbi:MAG: cell division ATP-binding protein FtsE [Gemmatimonadales bacterium]|nr:cell division ATP-binding protein FtsE [Gemmatimonadales bacterium]MDG2240927.1 cell division ATP-binding protein FtsE [Longimicrobiales bacterium]NCG31315.1 cell division ATP-binding protein FtsE [Pseudomonadota bacterium]MBT3498076.1 cell division ATP-binding protein FtsE [Gemmatimonadales bacterium]MBT3774141.1 cell division ATP-binding protein FtsE [Gemmatimonadales bacterium]